MIFRDINEIIETIIDNIIYIINKKNVKLILKYKNDEMNLLFINILFILIKFNLFNISRLIKKNIEIYFKNLNKFSHLLINNEIVEYIDIKNNLYYVKTIKILLIINSKNRFILFVIIQIYNYDFENFNSNIKYYFIINNYIEKNLKN